MKKINRMALGAFLVAVGALLLLNSSSLISHQTSDFSDVPSVEAAGQSYRPIQVRIPSVEIDLEIKNAKVVKGKWEVFETTAAYGEGSGLPGQTGNIVISAHARKGMFLPLKKVQKGETVFLLTENAEYEYRVVDIKEVVPTDISVIAETSDETLTLYTCVGVADSKRLVVVAKRVT